MFSPVLPGVYPGVSPELIRSDKSLPTARPLTLVWSLVLVAADVSLEVGNFREGFVAAGIQVTFVQLQIQPRVSAIITGTMLFPRVLSALPQRVFIIHIVIIC